VEGCILGVEKKDVGQDLLAISDEDVILSIGGPTLIDGDAELVVYRLEQNRRENSWSCRCLRKEGEAAIRKHAGES
jgi:hypothetical protein